MLKINENNYMQLNNYIFLKFTKYINKLNNTNYVFNHIMLSNDYST